VGIWCPVGTENHGSEWNALDVGWHPQGVSWSDVKFVG